MRAGSAPTATTFRTASSMAHPAAAYGSSSWAATAAVRVAPDPARDSAPVVVAKGKGAFAKRIAGLARQSGVPVLERPPLARALQKQFPDAKKILLRETGRYIRAEVLGVIPPKDFSLESLDIDGCDDWRVDSVSFRPV